MKKCNKNVYYITIFLTACLVFGLMFHYISFENSDKKEKFLAYIEDVNANLRADAEDIGGSCSIKSCGAIDPVSDPAYNMKNVIKQSILLEEHLAEDNKYCIDCCIKHFLHIQGLIEEAIWLSCKKGTYPLMKESDIFYKKMFELWLKDRRGKEIREKILSDMRLWRKKLVEVYYAEDVDF